VKKNLTTRQAAERLGVSLGQVRKYGASSLIQRKLISNGSKKRRYVYDAGSVNSLKAMRGESRLPRNAVAAPKKVQIKLPFGLKNQDEVLEAFNAPITPPSVVFKRMSNERLVALEERVELIFQDLQSLMKLVRDTAMRVLVDRDGSLVIKAKDLL